MKNNKRKGFSLVELVIVIAILAVLIAVLAPSLMTYTERSRAQKDVSQMDEVVNAVQLAMADQKCYDEMLRYSCQNNFITYTDSSGNYGQQIVDAEYWAPDGLGRATTITFNPTRKGNETYYVLENGIINDMTYGNGSIAEKRVMQGEQINENQCYFKNASLNGSQITGYTYNRVRQIIGDSTIATSATYANSSFTVFIRFNQKDGVTVADVNGSFNGTNLWPDSSASKGSGTNSYDDTGKPIVNTNHNTGKTETHFSGSDLQGTGSFVGSQPDYRDPTIEILEKDYEFEFYSSLMLAVNDVNNNSIGQSADCDKEDAVAGIYIDDIGNTTILLLKDASESETITIKKDLTLSLGRNKLTVAQDKSGIIVKNGTTRIIGGKGAVIEGHYTSSPNGITMITSMSNIVINKCKLVAYGTDRYYVDVVDAIKGTLAANDVEIYAEGRDEARMTGFFVDQQAVGIINNSKLIIKSEHAARNSNIDDPTAYGFYVYNDQTQINNCTVYTTGVAVLGIGNINGGTYQYSQFAIQAGKGPYAEMNKQVSFKIKNAKFQYVPLEADFISKTDGYRWPSSHVIKVSVFEPDSNISAHIHNCDFYVAEDTIYSISIASDQTNCNVYLSDTSFYNISSEKHLRVNNDNHVYIGKNCNFNANNAYYNNTNVTETNDIYK